LFCTLDLEHLGLKLKMRRRDRRELYLDDEFHDLGEYVNPDNEKADEWNRREEEKYQKLDEENERAEAEERIEFESMATHLILNASDRMKEKFERHGYKLNKTELNEQLAAVYRERFAENDYSMDCAEEFWSGKTQGKVYTPKTREETACEKLLMNFIGLENEKYFLRLICSYHKSALFFQWYTKPFKWFEVEDRLLRNDYALSRVATNSFEVKNAAGKCRYVVKSIVALPSVSFLNLMADVSDAIIDVAMNDKRIAEVGIDEMLLLLIIVIAFRIQMGSFDHRVFVPSFILYSKLKMAEDCLCAMLTGIGGLHIYKVVASFCEITWNLYCNDMPKLYSDTYEAALKHLRILLTSMVVRCCVTYRFMDQEWFCGSMNLILAGNWKQFIQPFDYVFNGDCCVRDLGVVALGVKELLTDRKWDADGLCFKEYTTYGSKDVRMVKCLALTNLAAGYRIPLKEQGNDILQIGNDIPSILECIVQSTAWYYIASQHNIAYDCILAINQFEADQGGIATRFDHATDEYFYLPGVEDNIVDESELELIDQCRPSVEDSEDEPEPDEHAIARLKLTTTSLLDIACALWWG